MLNIERILIVTVTLNNICGNYMSFDSSQHNNGWKGKLIFFNASFSILVIGVVGCCNTIVILDHKQIEDLEQTIAVTSFLISAGTFTVYLWVYNKDVNSLLVKMDKLIDKFNHEMFGDLYYRFEDDLVTSLIPVKYFGVIAGMILISLPIIDATPKYFKSWGFLNLKNETRRMHFQSPFRFENPPLYDINLMIQIVYLCYCIGKQFSTNYTFISIFVLQTKIYSHLNKNINFIINASQYSNESERNVSVKSIIRKQSVDLLKHEKFQNWIKVHQHIIGIGKDTLDLYSPILLLQFINLYGSTALMMFAGSQNSTVHTIVEQGIFITYAVMSLITFFVLCLSANELTEETKNLSWALYSTSWYNCNPLNKSLVKVIIQRAQIPFIVGCFRSTGFVLSNSTFIIVMKSIISFYITLSKIKGKT